MLLSIVIPTRNGGRYLIDAVSSVLRQKDLDCEVLVSVNHSSDGSIDRLAKFTDSRLNIISPPNLLSMSAHFEWCVTRAVGDWIAVIGDDDGVLPDLRSKFEDLRFRHPQAEIFVTRRCLYDWPGHRRDPSISSFVYRASKQARTISGPLLAFQALAGIAQFTNLPHLYTGCIVKRSVIERVCQKSGKRMIHGSSPDIYTGIAFALEARHIVRSELPCFIAGTSLKSNGLQQQRKSSLLSKSTSAELQDGRSESREEVCTTRALNEFTELSERDGVLEDRPLTRASISTMAGPLLCLDAFCSLPESFRRTHRFRRGSKVLQIIALTGGLIHVRNFDPERRSTSYEQIGLACDDLKVSRVFIWMTLAPLAFTRLMLKVFRSASRRTLSAEEVFCLESNREDDSLITAVLKLEKHLKTKISIDVNADLE